MKKLTYEQFAERLTEVAKARKIFIPSITGNISDAFALYQEVLAEEKMAVFISSSVGGNKPLTPVDDYVRPRCEECGGDMMLRLKVVDMENKTWPTAWHCPQCLIDFYSDKSVKEWMDELERADHAKK